MDIYSHLKKILHYNPDTGIFTWKITKRHNQLRHGDVAGSLHKEGYRDILFNKKLHKAHRLAWLYMTGDWPKYEIDHINRIKDDNRWFNLREAPTRSKQCGNAEKHTNNKSGFKAVYWDKQRRKWRTAIGVNGKKIYLGHRDTPQEAYQLYCVAALKYFGEFAQF